MNSRSLAHKASHSVAVARQHGSPCRHHDRLPVVVLLAQNVCAVSNRKYVLRYLLGPTARNTPPFMPPMPVRSPARQVKPVRQLRETQCGWACSAHNSAALFSFHSSINRPPVDSFCVSAPCTLFTPYTCISPQLYTQIVTTTHDHILQVRLICVEYGMYTAVSLPALYLQCTFCS